MDTIQGEAPTELSRLIAGFDWSSTPLGPMQHWPAYLLATVRLLLDSNLPIVTLWGEEGILIYNDSYAQFAGARHPSLLGAHVLQGWPEAADLNRRVLAAGLHGKTLSFRDEKLVLARHGYPETIWLDLDYSPIRNEAGTPAGIFAVVRETTQRVLLEQQREADATRQNGLVELGDRLRGCDTAGEVAAAVAAVLGRLLGCARAGYAVIRGQTTFIEGDWTDGTLASLAGEHAFAALGPRYNALLRRGEVLAVPDVTTHESTAESAACWRPIQVRALLNVPLLQNGLPAGLLYAHDSRPRDWSAAEIAIARDVADRAWEAMRRAQAVEALHRMNNTLEAQVRERTLQRDRMWTLSTDLMMVSSAAGIILSVNPAWTSVLGWHEEELVGASIFDFIHPEDQENTRAERGQFILGRPVINFQNRYRTRGGGVVWLSWKAVPDGDVIHSVARDITAERDQAEALQAAEESLRHAQKMEAVGQLTGGIAHDFNNLLQGILGSLEFVQKRLAQGRLEGLQDYAAQAKASAERAGALTHRLLAFSRRQPLAPKPVLANPLLLAMEPLLRRTLGEMIRLEFELEPALWPVLCDPNQLDSALLNLAINARDAMPGGGTLRLCSRNMEDGRIRIAVTDTGTGMPPDVVAHAFDPFYTTKPLGQGTGLGLSMVYGFMRQSGGQAKISSHPGSGTTVSLFLPRYNGELEEDDTIPPVPAASPGRGTVLVLEDEEMVRAIVVEVLEELGFDIIEAADGPAGLEILQSAQSIDLLVTDIGLPGLNGRQVAEAARQTRPALKILFMTGYAETAAMADGFLSPGMQMITKPFTIAGLAARITEITTSDAPNP
jgi:PAS domain S-box-containing protein